jgi:hypothetical protein
MAHPGAFHSDKSAQNDWHNLFYEAARFWEPRRLVYNSVLSIVAVIWVAATWPHFRAALTLSSLVIMAVLALLANLCYCAAYFVDIPIRRTAFEAIWSRRRWLLFLLGTLFAIVVENYWIADEIYPAVR